MVFGQLTSRDSLRDLIVALDAHKAKSYHLGLGPGVKLATLARAIFAEIISCMKSLHTT